MIIEGNVITADDGKTLTNGETYTKRAFLGIHDSPDNWNEIPDEEVPEEIPDAEALNILTGRDADEPQDSAQTP